MLGQWYWERIPAAEQTKLIEFYETNEYAQACRIINKYYAAPEQVGMCCKLEETWNRLEKAIEERWITKDT